MSKMCVTRFLFLMTAVVLFGTFSVLGQQPTAEEIISKNLASIGTPETIAKSKMRMAIGTSEFFRRAPNQTNNGRSVLASDGTNFAFFATFDMSDYSMERIGIFSNKINIPVLKAGARSPLGSYLSLNDKVLTDRIFGGPIFASWALFDRASLTGKWSVDGKKKVGEKEAWVLEYKPKPALRGGSTLKLYFDTQTYQLLRTVLKMSDPDRGFYEINGTNTHMTPDMAGNGSSLTEDFEDYKVANGLTLPHKYKIDLTLNGAAGTAQFKWTFGIVEYRIVRDFGEGFFAFTT